ncbi:MAG TPA: hypothetical protein VFV78_07985 [Vicinamibacterales bacterium]|nr:hypothetical protein [Vicinamibacterales bacterium]
MRRSCGSALAGVLTAILAGAGCNNTPTTPSVTPTSTTTVFASRIVVGGSAWRSFIQTDTSIVTARLGGLSPDENAVVRIGFGNFDGTTCTSTVMTVDTAPDEEKPQLSMPLPPGRYCVMIWDIGNLTKLNDFAIFLIQP